MGRPRIKFCWDNAVLLSNGKWKCKYCEGKGDDDKERAGGAQRIRNHLSGEGNGVEACKYVPPHIRKEALRISKSKSKGKDDDDVNDMAPCRVFERGEPSNIPVVAMPNVNNGIQISSSSWRTIFIAEGGTTGDMQAVDMEVEKDDLVMGSPTNSGSEDVAEFVKFLLSRNVSADILQDSHFRLFLERVSQNDRLLSSLLQMNPSNIIPKSLWDPVHEFTEYMEMVKRSWKTTSCTMVVYDFDQGGDKLILGLYCPKGFIFLEVDHHPTYCDFTKALKDLVPNLSMDDDVIRFIGHFSTHIVKCHYQARRVTDGSAPTWTTTINCINSHDTRCIRHSIHEHLCNVICTESMWVQSLIKKTDKVYEYIASSNMYGKYYKTLTRGRVEQFVDGKYPSSLSRLRTIMEHEQELRSWLSNLTKDQQFHLECKTEISEIVNDEKFWYDGNELLAALHPLLKIPDMMDTLIPTAAYLYIAIDKAKCVLKTYYERNSMKYSSIWDSFNMFVNDEVIFDPLVNVEVYLNPTCILREADWDLEQTEHVKYNLLRVCGGNNEEEALDEEMVRYNIKSSNPFAGISSSECSDIHPVKLWNNYGSRFPLLQKCAIKFLSQPVSCLCYQIKKHMSQLQGTDNYVLRLNYKMMEEFRKLGDDPYKPMDFQSLYYQPVRAARKLDTHYYRKA